jgi:serine/threonine-protein kinase
MGQASHARGALRHLRRTTRLDREALLRDLSPAVRHIGKLGGNARERVHEVSAQDDGDSDDTFLRAAANAPSAEPPAPDPSRVGRFRVLARLGQGGMGVVYRAEDETLGRQVALKILPTAFAADAERKRRMLREARAAAAVTHANIATVYEVGEADGRVFLAMELVEGTTLRALLGEGEMALDAALRIAMEIARGLAKAHRADVVHRDLKPDNVIVSADGPTKILDFGLAKMRAADAPDASDVARAETVTAEGRWLGTPAYTSPEQAKGRDVGPATDVFAFGVTLYEMVTGRRPFLGGSLAELIVAIDREAPPPASSLRKDVPAALDDLITACLAKDARDRIPNGDAIVAALSPLLPEALRDSLPRTSSRDVTAVRTPIATPRPRRGPSPLVLVLGTAVGALLFAAAFAFEARAPRDPARVDAPPVSSNAIADAAAPRWKKMTDAPPPKSQSKAALAAYQLGLQDFRDASVAHAHDMMSQALKEDPQLAAAHLRDCIYMAPEPHCRRALAMRDALDDRDRALLDTVEPLFTGPKPDYPVALARARAARDRFPDDEEIALRTATLEHQTEHANIGPLRDFVARDPSFGYAAWALGGVYIYKGQLDAARAANEKCVLDAPRAASCLGQLLQIAAAEGRCLDMEELARRRVAIDPETPHAYQILGYSMAANGADEALVFETLQRASEGESPPTLAIWRGQVHTQRGELADAEEWLAKAQGGLEKQKTDDDSNTAGTIALRALVLEESGRAADGGKVALDYLKRRAARADAPEPFAISTLIDAAVRTHAIDPKQATDLGAVPPGARALSSGTERDLRAALLSVTANDQDSAKAALSAMSDAPAFQVQDPLPLYRRGRVARLAGDLEGAAAALEAASRACSADDSISPRRAELLLGQVREAQKDTNGACEAYARVVAKWGHAKPKSITADQARDRMRALRCE